MMQLQGKEMPAGPECLGAAFREIAIGCYQGQQRQEAELRAGAFPSLEEVGTRLQRLVRRRLVTQIDWQRDVLFELDRQSWPIGAHFQLAGLRFAFDPGPIVPEHRDAGQLYLVRECERCERAEWREIHGLASLGAVLAGPPVHADRCPKQRR